MENVLDDILKQFEIDETIYNNALKTYYKLNDEKYDVIMVAISGGSDSDIVLDICTKLDIKKKCKYVWFDTSLEYTATKEHLKYLEEKYNIKIEREKAKIPVPLGCKKYGQPFLSKRISDCISRLQKNGFKWEDKPFIELYKEYPNCKSSLRWWCNDWGEKSKFNISYNKMLKEFMVQNPPNFKISSKCCDGAKKRVAHDSIKKLNAKLNIYGVRKSEGGARSTAYKSCFDNNIENNSNKEYDEYRPIFYYKDENKKRYETKFNIEHSDCYKKYGLKRTGYACCPFGKEWQYELEMAKQYDFILFTAATNIFKDSYNYTLEYYKFAKINKRS